MPFTRHAERLADHPVLLEEDVCIRIAQVMRGAAADLGLTHPWRDRLDELAVQFEQDAEAVAALPAREAAAGPPSLTLVR
jgi:hypothetical protein